MASAIPSYSASFEQPARAISAILRLPEVKRLTGLSRSTIYRLIDAGTFPAQRRLAVNSVGWVSAEIADWIEKRTAVHT